MKQQLGTPLPNTTSPLCLSGRKSGLHIYIYKEQMELLTEQKKKKRGKKYIIINLTRALSTPFRGWVPVSLSVDRFLVEERELERTSLFFLNLHNAHSTAEKSPLKQLRIMQTAKITVSLKDSRRFEPGGEEQDLHKVLTTQRIFVCL